MLVHVLSNFDHSRVSGIVIVQEGDVHKRYRRPNHRVQVSVGVLVAGRVPPLAVFVCHHASWLSSNDFILAEASPCLEGKLHIAGLVVCLSIGYQDGLGLEESVRRQLCVRAFVVGSAVANSDVVL